MSAACDSRAASALCRAWVLACAATLAACPGDDEPEIPPPPPAPDTTAPAVSARPGGGAYAAVQYVTLVANEIATVHYSTDGSEPVEGAANTASAPSPLSWIRLGPGTTTLRFYAVDAAGNRSAVETATYAVDASTPTVALTLPDAAPLGLLSSATMSWRADEPVTYSVELGGDGRIGSGVPVAAGDAAADVPVSHPVHGYQLPSGGASLLSVHVTDAAGHTTSRSVAFTRRIAAEAAVQLGTACRDIELLPGGKRAYLAVDKTVKVVDLDPASDTFEQVLATITFRGEVRDIALTPDGTRAWVGHETELYYDGQLSVIDTATHARLHSTDAFRSLVPWHVAVGADGKRAFVVMTYDGLKVVDVDPASATYGQLQNFPVRVNVGGPIVPTADGKRAIAGRHVVDLDPQSATYGASELLSPVATSYRAGPVRSHDGRSAYLSGCRSGGCGTYQLDLSTLEVVASGPWWSWNRLSATPDGAFLVTPTLEVMRAPDLSYAGHGGAAPASDSWSPIVVIPDGSHAYTTASLPGWYPALHLVRVPLR